MNHDATFRERVHEFWDWFPTQADQLANAVKSDNPQENLESFFDQVREKIGGLAWAFGPGSTDDTLSFTVTGEGEKSRQLLAQFWFCLLYTSPSPRDQRGSRMPSSA